MFKTKLAALIILMFIFLAGCSQDMDYSQYIMTEKAAVAQITEALKGESAGAAGWTTAFSDDHRIVFYNYHYLLSFDKKARRITAAVDLKSLNVNYIQGDRVTQFDFSPNGNFVVISNADNTKGSGLQDNVYLCDFSRGMIKGIAKHNAVKGVSSWSDASTYFALATQDSSSIVLYDTAHKRLKVIEAGIAKISALHVSDAGSIVVTSSESEKGYLLEKRQQYRSHELIGKPIVLDYLGNTLIYLKQGSIWQYDGIKDEVLHPFEGNPASVIEDNNLFIQPGIEKVTLVYRLSDGRSIHYKDDLLPDQILAFSPDLGRCIITDAEYTYISVRDAAGRVIRLSPPDVFGENTWSENKYHWYDNDTVFKVVNLREDSAGSFAIMGYKLYEKAAYTIYKQ